MSTNDDILRTLEEGRAKLLALREAIGRVIVGHESAVEGLLVGLLAGGHVLFEGVPGLGKTLLVRTLADALGLEFKRLQCTPDLMPADVIGTRVLIEEAGSARRFEFQAGPVFTEVLLADEINRATPKTQSALLEAMAERAVSIAGERRVLGPPFFVLATQNPIEMEGTFPLPEAQLDRFLFKLHVAPPSADELAEIVTRTTGAHEPAAPRVLEREELLAMMAAVREIPAPTPVVRYAARLVEATHPSSATSPDEVRRFVRHGASPRGAQALVLAAKARAALAGRPNASIEDAKASALDALSHRLVPAFEAIAEGVSTRELVESIVAALPDAEPADAL